MFASIASAPAWSGPQAAGPLWHLARLAPASSPSGTAALQWVMKRNCSMRPRDLAVVYLTLCVVSVVIALGFWWHGAPVVLAFAGLEMLVVGIALLVYARHAGDGETLTLDGQRLLIEHSFGSRVQRQAFRAEWVRVEPVHGEGSLLEVSGQGASAQVGRYLRPQWRGQLARELRQALRQRPAANEETVVLA